MVPNLKIGKPIQNYLWAILSGVLLTVSFPKFALDWMAWGALVPLLLALRDVPMGAGFRIGFVAGIIHYMTLMYWLVHTFGTYGQLPLYLAIPILFLLSAYLSLFIGAFSAMVVWLYRKPVWGWIMIPVVWVSLEYLRSFLLTGFPWELLGYSQFARLHLIQISDILGVYGVSFLLLLANAVLFMLLMWATDQPLNGRKINKRVLLSYVFVFIGALGLTLGYGFWRIQWVDQRAEQRPSIKVAVIQGNIDQGIKWDPDFQVASTKKYVELSKSVEKENPDLVVWPETATPFYFLNDLQLSKIVLTGIKDAKSDFFIGSPSYAQVKNRVAYFNSVYVIAPDGKIFGKYDKAHLVPFGEYVPLKKWLPFIGKMVEQVGDFQAGRKGTAIDWKGIKLGPLICYEIIFPYLAREMVKNKAELLVNVTNDAWYGKSSAPYQHFSMAVFRAVENKRALVRSANTGISGFIDPAGRVLAETAIFEDAAITQQVPLIREMTVYTRFGDLFAQICLVITLIVMVIHFKKKKYN